jgi:hypothetical protein
MPTRKPKLMLIGLDSVSLSLLDTFKARTPNIRKAMARGFAGRALSCFPVYTPTNWAALSTGADPGWTRAASWVNEYAGERLSTFDRRAIGCETIFEAAPRARLTTLAIAYPSAYPPRTARNMVLAPLHRGLVTNCLVPGRVLKTKFGADGAFSFPFLEAQDAPSGAALAKVVGATEDGQAAGVAPASSRPSAGKMPALRAANGVVPACLVRRGPGRWSLQFGGKHQSELRAETWSAPIRVKLNLAGRPGDCVVRVMVFDGGRRVAVSEAYDVGMLGAPRQLAAHVYDRLGPPTEHSAFYKEIVRLVKAGEQDPVVYRLMLEELEAQTDWIVAAAKLVQAERPYDVFYLHYHHPDSVLHTFLARAEGSKRFTARQQREARRAIGDCLRISDRLIGGLLKLAGPETTVLLVSDHGNCPNRYQTSLRQRLLETGLLVANRNGKLSKRRSVAWPDARAGTWVTVNAPRGSARYEAAQRKVLDALLDWKAPDGERVVAFALRRKDAHLVGLHGEHCPDVVFHFSSGFAWGGDKSVTPATGGANHGPQMPVTFSKLSDNLAFFVLAGPRVARGVRWDEDADGYVRITDLVPTACAAAGVPCPRHATGAVRQEILNGKEQGKRNKEQGTARGARGVVQGRQS